MTMAILIAAGGNSARLGRPKQLVSVAGDTLLGRTIALCDSLGPDVYCVLGAYAKSIRAQVSHPNCRFLYHLSWRDGLSSSIAFGVSQLPATTSAVMIVLADQWALSATELEYLMAQYFQHKQSIHCARTNGRIGPPTIFPQYCFDALKQLAPHGNGAKAVIKQYRDKVKAIELPSAEFDLDTPLQLQQLQSLERNHDLFIH